MGAMLNKNKNAAKGQREAPSGKKPGKMPQMQGQYPQYSVQPPQYPPQYPPQPLQYPPQPLQYPPQPLQYPPQPPQFQQFPSQFQPSQQGVYPPSSYPQQMMPSQGMINRNSTNQPDQTWELDMFLSNLTGWPLADIEKLRQEFKRYANHNGTIDREGFRKIHVSALLNTSWENVEQHTEIAFRNFDVNQSGSIDFYEYVTAASRMTRDLNGMVGQGTNIPARY